MTLRLILYRQRLELASIVAQLNAGGCHDEALVAQQTLVANAALQERLDDGGYLDCALSEPAEKPCGEFVMDAEYNDICGRCGAGMGAHFAAKGSS